MCHNLVFGGISKAPTVTQFQKDEPELVDQSQTALASPVEIFFKKNIVKHEYFKNKHQGSTVGDYGLTRITPLFLFVNGQLSGTASPF